MHHHMGDDQLQQAWLNATGGHVHRRTKAAHATFYWGKHADVFFSGWPCKSTAMYYFVLVVVFAIAVLVEWLSHSSLVKPGSNRVAAGFSKAAALQAVRAGFSYMAILAVMSFNGGVFLAAISGHAVGFSLFRSTVLKEDPGKLSDLPPLSG